MRDFPEIDFDRLAPMAELIHALAATHYQPNGQLSPALLAEYDFQPWKMIDAGEDVPPEEMARIGRKLSGMGFTGFAPRARGTSAMVIAALHKNGNMVAIRIPHDITDPTEHIRAEEGPVLQPLASFENFEENPIDILPLGLVYHHMAEQHYPALNEDDHRKLKRGLIELKKIYANLGYEPTFMTDIFIAPGGVTLFTDPDICEPARGYKIARGPDIHADIRAYFPAAEADIICSLMWVDEAGQSRQHQVYGADYLSPQRPKVRPSAKAAKPK